MDGEATVSVLAEVGSQTLELEVWLHLPVALFAQRALLQCGVVLQGYDVEVTLNGRLLKPSVTLAGCSVVEGSRFKLLVKGRASKSMAKASSVCSLQDLARLLQDALAVPDAVSTDLLRNAVRQVSMLGMLITSWKDAWESRVLLVAVDLLLWCLGDSRDARAIIASLSALLTVPEQLGDAGVRPAGLYYRLCLLQLHTRLAEYGAFEWLEGRTPDIPLGVGNAHAGNSVPTLRNSHQPRLRARLRRVQRSGLAVDVTWRLRELMWQLQGVCRPSLELFCQGLEEQLYLPQPDTEHKATAEQAAALPASLVPTPAATAVPTPGAEDAGAQVRQPMTSSVQATTADAIAAQHSGQQDAEGAHSTALLEPLAQGGADTAQPAGPVCQAGAAEEEGTSCYAGEDDDYINDGEDMDDDDDGEEYEEYVELADGSQQALQAGGMSGRYDASSSASSTSSGSSDSSSSRRNDSSSPLNPKVPAVECSEAMRGLYTACVDVLVPYAVLQIQAAERCVRSWPSAPSQQGTGPSPQSTTTSSSASAGATRPVATTASAAAALERVLPDKVMPRNLLATIMTLYPQSHRCMEALLRVAHALCRLLEAQVAAHTSHVSHIREYHQCHQQKGRIAPAAKGHDAQAAAQAAIASLAGDWHVPCPAMYTTHRDCTEQLVTHIMWLTVYEAQTLLGLLLSLAPTQQRRQQQLPMVPQNTAGQQQQQQGLQKAHSDQQPSHTLIASPAVAPEVVYGSHALQLCSSNGNSGSNAQAPEPGVPTASQPVAIVRAGGSNGSGSVYTIRGHPGGSSSASHELLAPLLSPSDAASSASPTYSSPQPAGSSAASGSGHSSESDEGDAHSSDDDDDDGDSDMHSGHPAGQLRLEGGRQQRSGYAQVMPAAAGVLLDSKGSATSAHAAGAASIMPAAEGSSIAGTASAASTLANATATSATHASSSHAHPALPKAAPQSEAGLAAAAAAGCAPPADGLDVAAVCKKLVSAMGGVLQLDAMQDFMGDLSWDHLRHFRLWRVPALARHLPLRHQSQALSCLFQELYYVYEDDDYDAPVLYVRRGDLVGSSMAELMGYEPYQIQAPGICVYFEDEAASGDGVLREWLTEVSAGLFRPDRGLFRPCGADQRALHLHPAAAGGKLRLWDPPTSSGKQPEQQQPSSALPSQNGTGNTRPEGVAYHGDAAVALQPGTSSSSSPGQVPGPTAEASMQVEMLPMSGVANLTGTGSSSSSTVPAAAAAAEGPHAGMAATTHVQQGNETSAYVGGADTDAVEHGGEIECDEDGGVEDDDGDDGDNDDDDDDEEEEEEEEEYSDDPVEAMRFAGRIIGMALRAKVPLGVHLSTALYRLLQRRGRMAALGLDELSQLEPQVAAGARHVMEAAPQDVEGLGLCFAVSEECPHGAGGVRDVELAPGGANIPVTAQNRGQYLKRLIQYYCCRGCHTTASTFPLASVPLCADDYDGVDVVVGDKEQRQEAASYSAGGPSTPALTDDGWQEEGEEEEGEELLLDMVEALAQGITDACDGCCSGPRELGRALLCISAATFNAALGGELAPPDPEDWRTHTTAPDFNTPELQGLADDFWAAVEQLDGVSRRLLLQFWTGSGHVPCGGFSQQPSKLQLLLGPPGSRLLHAHTCFNQLALPRLLGPDGRSLGVGALSEAITTSVANSTEGGFWDE